jgi:hypothetical protein
MQLAKLLAKENITIQEGNYKTAWFDIKNRVLGLPMWKDMGKDVKDLLIGHEVGHALETPYEGWHDSPEKLEGCPRSYINVIEDARIERKVKTRYPGLVGPFSRGYKKLTDEGFFGDDILDTDWNEVKLIDKINLKAKIGNLIDVPFSDEEIVFYNRAMSTNEFSEVLDLVRDILAYTKENQSELLQPKEIPMDDQQESEGDQNDDPTSDGHDDLESDNQENTDENMSNTNGDGAETTEEDEQSEEAVAAPEPTHSEADVSVTDEIFRSSEKNLLDVDENGRQPLVCRDIPKSLRELAVVDYKDLSKAREARFERIKSFEESYYDEAIDAYNKARYETYPKYIKDVKKNIQFAVKEFEQRKAATQWQKASVSKTGNLDVNKLWSYKTNDDIFLRTTRLADSKNHGMIMIVDYSGSMSSSIKYVLDQVIHTVMFCKAVNIPFEVYAFTSTNTSFNWEMYKDGDVELDDISMPLLTSSSLKKKDFEESLQNLHMRIELDGWTSGNFIAKAEDWGSTPLNQALIIAHDICKKFKAKNNVEKLNLITFTDGDSNHLRVISDKKMADMKFESDDYYYSNDGFKILIDGKAIKSETRRLITAKLLQNLSDTYGINTIGFFMADNNHMWNSKLGDICWAENKIWEDWRSEARKEYTKNKCVTVEGYGGYNTYYLVKGNKNLDTDADEFDVNEDATKGQIGTAFKKYSKSKKLNKVLMTKFGAAVA